MFIAQTFKYLNSWYLYILGVLISIIGVFVFSVPHLIAIGIKAIDNPSLDMSNMNDESVLYTLFDPNLNLVFLLLPFAGSLLFLFFAVKFIHKQPLKALTTSRLKIDWSRFWFVFLVWGVLSAITIGVDFLIYPEHYLVNFNLTKFLILVCIAVILVPIQTSFEEYLFRGYLMQGIGVLVKNKWFPLIVTSVVFGLLHIANPEVTKIGNIIMVYYIGTGFFLGIITLMDEGLELALGFHAANNLIGALLVSADWTAFQTHSILKDISDPTVSTVVDIIIPVLVIYPILLFILSKRYKWTNWKDRLLGSVKQPENTVV